MSNFYADRIYKNAAGEYFTGEYLKNQHGIEQADAHKHGYKDVKLYAKSWDEYTDELTGKTVYCNYNQIFYPDSNMILCNEIPNVFPDMWEYIENGTDYYDDDTYADIYQYYIIDPGTAERLKEHTDEIIYYIEKLDVYVLGVTHYGTSWSHCGAEFIY
jgi:hypothetical protein